MSPRSPDIVREVRATGLLPTRSCSCRATIRRRSRAPLDSVIVRIVGPNNTPMQGVTVGFQVLSGGGGMPPLTVVTNALGEATTKWTLGVAGGNTALVTAGISAAE